MRVREHEVFISYSSKNKNIADMIVADLEQNGIKCWYAPRDILVGEDWAGAIKNAIQSTEVFVLVYTDESNRSHQVTNEVTLAVNAGKIIIPFRLSSSNMNDTLEYYLSSVHWLDAVTQPLSAHVETLRRQIQALLEIEVEQNTSENSPAESKGSSMKGGIAIGILAAALLVGIGTFALSGDHKEKTDNSPAVVTEQEQKTEDESPDQKEAEETAPEVDDSAIEEEAVNESQDLEETSQAAPEESKEAEEEQPAEKETSVMIPDKALYYNGHHYFIYNDIKTNWDEAAANCRDRGGYLAVINDAEENEKMFKYMTAMGFDQAFFGLTYSHGKDEWVYLDGGSSDFRDWGCNSRGEKEPNNATGSEYHVQFDINMQDGHWNDAKFGAKVYTPDGVSYKNRYTYICEWDQ